MREHALKTWPQYFAAIQVGIKTFEVRYDDRGFQAGDTVRLREYDPAGRCRCYTDLDHHPRCQRWTGRELTARIGYVMNATPNGCGRRRDGSLHNFGGYVVFSLLDVAATHEPRDERDQ